MDTEKCIRVVLGVDSMSTDKDWNETVASTIATTLARNHKCQKVRVELVEGSGVRFYSFNADWERVEQDTYDVLNDMLSERGPWPKPWA